MPPRNTDGSLDRGPSRRTSSQIKKRGTAKAASKRLMSEMKNRRRKRKKNKSVGDKLMSGIRGIGSDIAMGLGLKDKTDDYLNRTADSVAVRRAIERGDPSSLRSDLQSRYRREKMMKDRSDRKRKERRRASREEQNKPPVDPTPTPTPTPPDAGLPSIPRKPEVTPEMRRAALEIFESQQGAGQVPYYMAAARNQFNPNMSPAFQYAAQNYDVLGAQRLVPRPMEMMSVAERQQINRMAEGMAQPPQIDYRTMPSPQQDYQQGMNMVMRGGGKGGPATGQQSMPPQGLAALLAQRFGGFGGQ